MKVPRRPSNAHRRPCGYAGPLYELQICEDDACGSTARENASDSAYTACTTAADTGACSSQATAAAACMREAVDGGRPGDEWALLAGFEKVELIQEPVASALAAGWTPDDASGSWLVYDLGGGTFDVSLLETRDGLLRVIGHDGDNFLGGRDLD